MTNEHEPARQAPTIDLEATEVEGGASSGAAAADPGPAAQAEAAAAGASADASVPRPRWYKNTAMWLGALSGALAGACIYLLLQVANPFAPPPKANPPATAAADPKRVDDLATRIAKLEAGGAGARASLDAAAANRVSTIEGELRTLSESVGILRRRADELASAAREARQRADAAAPPAGVDALSKLDGELQNALSRLTTTERAQKSMETQLAQQESAGNADRGGRFAIATTALGAAIERGQPFAPELSVVKSFAADGASLAALEPFAVTGVPSTATLGRELTALVPQLVAATGRPAREGSFLEKLQANAEKLIRVRPLEQAQGSDPEDIVARIGMKASNADVSGALADLERLAPALRAPAEPWIKKAHDRSAAIEASRRLAADALAGLTK